MSNLSGASIKIRGIVQGVGFRPFVYSLATRLGVNGWVRNTSAGVDIEVDGSLEQLDAFKIALLNEAPPLAHIDAITFAYCSPNGYSTFEIVKSESIFSGFQPISPDICICPDCLRELFDPSDRRYLYPFINCTNCGPRFTIITDIPYDRPNTTMAPFVMCHDCAEEYNNPLDRRFHAQPVACHICGPQPWLEILSAEKGMKALDVIRDPQQAIIESQRLLLEGKIVAIKGIGGFHLACDAINHAAVQELRKRKLRVDKPFALMMADINSINLHCSVKDEELQLLTSRERPIVILQRRETSNISRFVAPNQNTLGVMLPYSPLHYLLFANLSLSQYSSSPKLSPNPISALVMTSGNLSEEPLVIDNDTARTQLNSLADAFLMHNRDIYTRCDDSVTRLYYSMDLSKLNISREGHTTESRSTQSSYSLKYPLRRSRGYSPFPVHLPWHLPPILATGAELKNTFCITRDEYAFLSHHIGDLENYETYQSFQEGIEHYKRIFRVKPELITHDLHPDYLSTRYANESAAQYNIPIVGVQHHHAHIAACMVENELDKNHPTLGFAFDGTGFGEDGNIWGGEVLLADYKSYQRLLHLAYVPLPGGEKAIREPWRVGLSWLFKAGLEWEDALPPVKYVKDYYHQGDQVLVTIENQIRSGINAPITSSIGRLFDAISSICGIRQLVNYEAQAAIEFEAMVDPGEEAAYTFEIVENIYSKSNDDEDNSLGESSLIIDPAVAIRAAVDDIRNKISLPRIAARFHNGVAKMVLEASVLSRERRGITEISLSGGVWQNMTLLSKVHQLLIRDGFSVLLHSKVPPNDGGVALGQAVIAYHNFYT